MSRRVSPDVELIPFPEGPVATVASPVNPPPNSNGGGTTIKVNVNPIVLFFIVVLLYIALSIWATAGEKFIFSGILGGRPLTWWQYVLVALVISGIVILVTYLSGITLTQLESEI